jgi:hypothetical protein
MLGCKCATARHSRSLVRVVASLSIALTAIPTVVATSPYALMYNQNQPIRVAHVLRLFVAESYNVDKSR